MERFVDLRNTDVDYAFAWFDTVRDQFETHGGNQVWDTLEEFLADYTGDERDRYIGLAPGWVK